MTDPPAAPLIRYGTVYDFPGWEKAEAMIRELIERYRPRTIFEVGSGANPTLSIADVNRYGVHYITSDRDEGELAKADPGYTARAVDLSEGPIPVDLLGQCDMVFSRMVNEHIRDGRRYHTNIFSMLAPGGVAVHAFSTLYTLPFLANYLLPSGLGDGLFNIFSPRDRHQHDKFPAYYSWSFGPTRNSIARFQSIGYEIVSYDGYFGHLYYRGRLPLLHRLEELKSRTLLRLKAPLFCAYASLVLRKPATALPQQSGD